MVKDHPGVKIPLNPYRKKDAEIEARELSLRPYNGRLYVTRTVESYESSTLKLFKTPDILDRSQDGRFAAGEGNDGLWTYLVYGNKYSSMAHELSHVILHVFERCGIDPREANGEPFCYMLSQLLDDFIKYKSD